MKLHLIQNALDNYVKYIKKGGSMYKWKAQYQFQEHWNPNAVDFGQMHHLAISNEFVKTWWKERPRNIHEPIMKMAEKNLSDVKQMFQDLLYPRVSIDSRIIHFKEDCERIFSPLYHNVDLGLKNHGHDDLEVIFMYLAFHLPESYPLYRYQSFIRFLNIVEARNKPEPYAFDDIIKTHQIILTLILRDESIVQVFQDTLRELYNPTSLILSQDFIEYTGRV